MSFLVQAQRERVGRRIRSARLQSGLSHDRLAASVGSSRQHLIKLEKGQHLPGAGLLARIAQETGKPLDYFESEDDEESSRVPSLDEMLRLHIRQVLRDELQAVRV